HTGSRGTGGAVTSTLGGDGLPAGLVPDFELASTFTVFTMVWSCDEVAAGLGAAASPSSLSFARARAAAPRAFCALRSAARRRVCGVPVTWAPRLAAATSPLSAEALAAAVNGEGAGGSGER